jgi:aspartyl protease family protein
MQQASPDPQHKRKMDPNRTIGRWMIFAAWTLILLLLTALFSGWLERVNNPNRILQVLSGGDGEVAISLKRNRAGHYVAPGVINGEAVVFLLDTGATQVALSAELADRIGLRRGVPISSLTANGYTKSWLTRLDRVELGPFVMRDVQATILPSMPTDEVLLGMNFLKHLELIQKGSQLVIRAPKPN